MRKIVKYCFVLSTLFVLINCSDIFEEDISGKTVTALYPNELDTIIGTTTQFRWLEIEDVDEYRLQILLQNRIIVDSLVETEYVNYNLEEGDYAWRVRAENFAYESKYSTQNNFTVISSDDLNNQLVILDSPSNNFYSNSKNITFSWSRISKATSYEIQILKSNNGTASIVDNPDELVTTTYTPDVSVFDTDAIYTWRVRAINKSSTTEFSSNILNIDTTAPNTPTVVLPADNFTGEINTEINFQWTLAADSGTFNSPVTATIEISNTADFSNILSSFPNLNTAQQNIQFSNSGTFFWRVKAIDLAQNESATSTPRTITIN